MPPTPKAIFSTPRFFFKFGGRGQPLQQEAVPELFCIHSRRALLVQTSQREISTPFLPHSSYSLLALQVDSHPSQYRFYRSRRSESCCQPPSHSLWRSQTIHEESRRRRNGRIELDVEEADLKQLWSSGLIFYTCGKATDTGYTHFPPFLSRLLPLSAAKSNTHTYAFSIAFQTPSPYTLPLSSAISPPTNLLRASLGADNAYRSYMEEKPL